MRGYQRCILLLNPISDVSINFNSYVNFLEAVVRLLNSQTLRDMSFPTFSNDLPSFILIFPSSSFFYLRSSSSFVVPCGCYYFLTITHNACIKKKKKLFLMNLLHKSLRLDDPKAIERKEAYTHQF